MIPFVTINLDHPRQIRFGMGAQIEFEQLTKIKLGALAKELENELSMETIAKALWVMLRQEDKELTLETVCNLVDENADNLTDITQAVSEAITAAWEVKNRPNAPMPQK